MNENFEKTKRIIEGQKKLMKEDDLNIEFINKFNDDTIKKLAKEFKLTEEEISKLKEI